MAKQIRSAPHFPGPRELVEAISNVQHYKRQAAYWWSEADKFGRSTHAVHAARDSERLVTVWQRDVNSLIDSGSAA